MILLSSNSTKGKPKFVLICIHNKFFSHDLCIFSFTLFLNIPKIFIINFDSNNKEVQIIKLWYNVCFDFPLYNDNL